MLALLITVPFFSILFFNLPFLGSLRRAITTWAYVLFCAQIALALRFFSPEFLNSFTSQAHLFNFNIALDNLSLIILLSSAIVLFITLIIATYTIDSQRQRFNFVNLLLFAQAGLNGLCLARDMFSLYIFIEIVAVTSYILIVFDKDIKALSAAFKYVILSTVASVFMVASIALMLLISGDTKFSVIQKTISGQSPNFLIMFSVVLFVCAAFVKAGVVPFHGWLPEVYSRSPAAVSVLFSGIISKALGIYTLMRVAKDVFGVNVALNNVLLFIGTVSIIVGALAALVQKDFKKMLGFSSISQIGYIILGVGSGTILGFAGAAFHIFNHAIFKSLLFVNSAAIESRTRTTHMHELGGLSKVMPITGFTSILGFISAAGLPPLAGFWSKLLIVMALILSGHFIYAILAIVLSALTLAYLLSMQRLVFFGKLNERFIKIKEAEFGFSLAAIILAAIIIITGLFYPFVLGKFILPLV
ncbi:MAG: NADH-quinone oxidoreductase subunit L [Candidatus Omnitrophica bacterium]|jgi:multicomponent Na+:H+ antiporter subunit D|nr:NADH-quinone oxidoreductase subunit L [Candidatus Omnitrophota bacterium]